MILNLLQRVCKSLDESDIPYMISGSIALNIYSIPRMTRDIDIVVELTENRIDEFTALFPDSYFNKEVIKDEIKRQGMFNIIDHQTGFKIDFIIRKETEYFNLAFQRRQRIKEFDTDIWVIRLEDLVIAKFIWIQKYQSDKQLSDIKNLLLNPDKDMTYIKEWCNALKLQTFNLLHDG
ncbi:MAG: hypothetical protein NTX61_13725 [Bacteroidetes bacterium]|nr:hypothetical protein [Bacteroidota bacterium]